MNDDHKCAIEYRDLKDKAKRLSNMNLQLNAAPQSGFFARLFQKLSNKAASWGISKVNNTSIEEYVSMYNKTHQANATVEGVQNLLLLM